MATMVRKPGPNRPEHSISVGGKELPIENGYIHNVPDHLTKELEAHGFWTEEAALGYEVMKAKERNAEDDRKKAEAEREEEDRKRSFDRMKWEEKAKLQAADEAKAEFEAEKKKGKQDQGKAQGQ